MSRKLVNHNPDLKRLADEGYSVQVRSGYLIVSHIPYLNHKGQVQLGTLVSPMTFVSEAKVGRPSDHQIFFCGEQPCHLDGSAITQLGGSQNATDFGEGLRSTFLWSNKPKDGFPDFFSKVENYVNIIAGPAMEVDSNATPRGFLEYRSEDADTPFFFVDTMSSRAGIFDINRPFENHVVSIVGLGGTGSYILDFVSKMPVSEIRLFDDDKFFVHNAFRRPGSTDENDFDEYKVELFAKKYGKFHRNVRPFVKRITSEDYSDLVGSTLVFVCVDNGNARMSITRCLADLGIPFIDVGMGLGRTDSGIDGLIRTTLADEGNWDELVDGGFIPIEDAADNVYSTNIQIAELNALNACLAVIKYKRKFGFYSDSDSTFHSLFNIGTESLFFHYSEDDEE